MDELIKTVSEKAGINPEQAKTAIASVFEFIKGKVPLVGDQLQGLLGGGESASPLAGAADAMKKKFGF